MSKLPPLAQTSSPLQPPKETCRDNECPCTLHKVTLFYYINFAAIVPSSTVSKALQQDFVSYLHQVFC